MTSSFSKISTAVILAAGMGIRLRDVTGLLPKGLLEIGGQSLIYRSLKNLKKGGIDRAVIVTGFQESLYHERLQPRQTYLSLNLFTVSNSRKPAACIPLCDKELSAGGFFAVRVRPALESRALPL
ncbi:MAG: hypothetical protein CM1200mP30_09730 [Pseudomonadota bacterium]|nr:MAG: hypothetical protein CM1200mP30_09730 [Pseudomonadota bacterium]